MVEEKLILRGLKISNNNKWYCNHVEDSRYSCCDTYDENGCFIQRVGSYILTGNENWRYNSKSKCYYFSANNKYFDDIDGGSCDAMLCTHFRWTEDKINVPLYMFSGGDTNEIQFNFDNGTGGIENFVKWLSKKFNEKCPVEVVYVLKNPVYKCLATHKRTRQYILNGFYQASIDFNKK